MPLFLNNEDVDQLLTMKDTMEAMEILYREMGAFGCAQPHGGSAERRGR